MWNSLYQYQMECLILSKGYQTVDHVYFIYQSMGMKVKWFYVVLKKASSRTCSHSLLISVWIIQ